jgi:WbqC-like protein family
MMQDCGAGSGSTVAVIQSNYIPWKGYFDTIHDAGLFIFYDDAQYTTNDWRNRNRIKSRDGASWLTVPVRSRLGQAISEVGPSDPNWAARHWKTLLHNYSKAPHFRRYRDFFEGVYLATRWDSLSKLNQHLIVGIARDLLGMRTEFRNSAEYPAAGGRLDRVDRLIALLKSAGARTYVSGPSARGYIDAGQFAQAGIGLVYKSYDGYPEYPQFHPPFEHRVSILDLLFHTGPDAPYYIWGWRDEKQGGAEA